MRRSRLLAAIAILTGTLAGLGWLLSPIVPGSVGFDAVAYLGAAGALADGHNPYDLALALGDRGAYWYPPVAALPFVPLAGLDLALVTALLAAVSLAALSAVLFGLAGGGWRGIAAAVLGAGSLAGLPATVYGNTTTLVVACVGLVALGEVRRDARVGGVGLAVGALAKLTPAILIAYLLARRSGRAVALAAVIIAAVTGASLAIPALREAWLAYPAVLRAIGLATVEFPKSLSIPDALAATGMGGVALVRPLLLLAGLALLVAGGRMRRIDHGFALATVGLQLAVPLAWVHYALFWLPALALLLAERRGRLRTSLLLGGFAAVSIVYLAYLAGGLATFAAYWAPGILIGLVVTIDRRAAQARDG